MIGLAQGVSQDYVLGLQFPHFGESGQIQISGLREFSPESPRSCFVSGHNFTCSGKTRIP